MPEQIRCAWVNLNNPLYIEYHDKEWGRPCYDDKRLFEMLVLESFQAGLSWECILNKRAAFHAAFDGFDAAQVAKYNTGKIDELMSNKAIVRNRQKIKASIANAKIFIDIAHEYGTFSKYIWHWTNGAQIINRDGVSRVTSSLSDMISCDLYRRGMRFVGSVIIYSYLQAIGIIDDHLPNCICAMK